MTAHSTTAPKKVFSAIHNLPKKIKLSHLGDRLSTRDKENAAAAEPTLTSSASSVSLDAHEKWLPKDGMIILKVAVPVTDDLWKFRVPEDVTLHDLLGRVEQKVGLPIAFAYRRGKARERAVTSERAFRTWVVGRIRNGKNTHLIAHVRL